MAELFPRLIKKLGYSAIRATGELPPHVPELRHAPVLPYRATYSPWLTDESFIQAFEAVRPYTLVDPLRCHGLWSLVKQSSKLSSGALIEVGVWRGGTGCLIAQAAKHFGITDPVYLCDTFSGVVKAGPMDTRYRGGEHADTSRAIAESLARSLRLDNVSILAGVFPDETYHRVTPPFRFCHIDVDVYESTKSIMEYLWPRIVSGGIVVFDDYGTHGCEGVTRIVNELADLPGSVFVHNLNGHGVIVKI